jgi:uncharacterized membrane protein
MFGFVSSNIDTHHINASGLALDILEKPYALGKIDKEEYEEKKRTLTDTKNQ